MPGKHKHPPLPFRPPEDERAWLLKYAADIKSPVNALLTEALRAYRKQVENETTETKEQDR